MPETTTLEFKLVTPANTLFDEQVEQVMLNTQMGHITIRPRHAHLVSILEPGELVVRRNGKDAGVAVAGGLIEMSDNTLVVLADTAEHPSEIDIEAAERRAMELAEELETQTKMDIKSYNALLRSLQHEQARLQVGKKWRS